MVSESSLLAPFARDLRKTRNHNRAPTMIKATNPMPAPIPALAPVERPAFELAESVAEYLVPAVALADPDVLEKVTRDTVARFSPLTVARFVFVTLGQKESGDGDAGGLPEYL